jgi:putative transposase
MTENLVVVKKEINHLKRLITTLKASLQDVVVTSIKDILKHEFIDCGYRLMSSYLTRDGYTINHKKLYRIMKEEGLLKLDNRIDRSGSGRKFVKFRKVYTDRP